jgi:hypothetical protein
MEGKKDISGLEREIIVTKNNLVFYIKKLEIDLIVNLLYNLITFVFDSSIKRVKFIDIIAFAI